MNPELLQLAARIGEPIEDPADVSLAEAFLTDAWRWVATYGDAAWSFENPETPPIARTIVLSCAQRAYQNPGGFEEEKADAVSLRRSDGFAQLTHPTVQEIAALRSGAKRGGRVATAPLENRNLYYSRMDAYEERHNPNYTVQVGDPNHRAVPWFTGVY